MNKIIKSLRLNTKKLISLTGYSIVPVKGKSQIVLNVFNSKHSKNALLSYVKTVFESDSFLNARLHTNRYTTHLIAETLNELGYNVDVINYDDCITDDLQKYGLVIGLGWSLEKILVMRAEVDVKVIYFATGCNPLFSNTITLERLTDFYKRNKKIFFSSIRYIKEDWPLQHQLADWIILHGSNFAKNTYRANAISTINAPVFIEKSIHKTDEEWNNAKRYYIWFGSDGAIHKGLDLLIESFATLPDYHLHICGNLSFEMDFFNFYKPIFENCANITYHGFVAVGSAAFELLIRTSAFIIYPSASEGNSPSVITCIANGGLIPIITANADVDLNGSGILIEDLSIAGVIKSIMESQNLSVEELKKQSSKLMAESRNLNSFDYFKKDFKIKLSEALLILTNPK